MGSRRLVCAWGVCLVVGVMPRMASADDGDWYAESGVLAVTRDAEEGETLVRVGGASVFKSDDELAFDFDVGAYVAVGKHLDEETAVETRAFWTELTQRDSIAGPNNLDVFPQQGGVNQLDDAVLVNAKYESELVNLEANVKRQVNDQVTAYGGFRYIHLVETLAVHGTDNGATSTYDIDTINHLLGGHGGVEVAHAVNDRLGVGGRAGAGVFANLAEQDQTVGDLPSLGRIIRDVNGDETAFAWLAEATASARLQVNDRVHVQGGYAVMFIDGVALAPGQFDVSAIAAGTGVDSDGHALYHGGFLGLGATF